MRTASRSQKAFYSVKRKLRKQERVREDTLATATKRSRKSKKADRCIRCLRRQWRSLWHGANEEMIWRMRRTGISRQDYKRSLPSSATVLSWEDDFCLHRLWRTRKENRKGRSRTNAANERVASSRRSVNTYIAVSLGGKEAERETPDTLDRNSRICEAPLFTSIYISPGARKIITYGKFLSAMLALLLLTSLELANCNGKKQHNRQLNNLNYRSS